MAEQRAVGLSHLMSSPLALGVVGLGEVDGDEPVVVAGEHRLGAVGEKIEGEAGRVLEPRHQRQAQLEQRVEQPVFRHFQHAPVDEVLLDRQVGNGAVVAASRTGRIGTVDPHQPIADAVHEIGAIAIAPARHRKRLPHRRRVLLLNIFRIRPQRRDGFARGEVAEGEPAAFAHDVLEIERLAAILALKELHGPSVIRA